MATAGDDVRGRRDRALILVGYLGALRRIELSALDVADLTVAPGGLVVRVGGAGRAQEGGGRVAILPYDADRTAMCPVRAVRDWQDSAGIVDGPLWRAVHRNNTRVLTGRLTTEAIADILRRHAMATTRTSGRGDLRSLQRT